MKKAGVRWGLICFLTYLSAYLCRVNFSAALSGLSVARGLDYELLGTAGAAFFAVYAVGQLINGFLGDHLHPVRFVLLALLGTALCNIGVAFARSFFAIFLLWASNGYFQSIFWSILIRLLSMVTDEKGRSGASALMSCAMPSGYLISWCVLAPCFEGRNVLLYFLVPAFAALPMMLLWVNKSALLPKGHTHPLRSGSLSYDFLHTLGILRREGILLLPATLICHGLIKEGVAFWIPTVIRGAADSSRVVFAALALLPLANYAGTFAAKWLLNRWENTPFRVIRASVFLTVPACFLCFIPKGVLILLPMCLISCLGCCANTVLVSYLPMRYGGDDAVSSLVGLFDFCSYVGAALSTYVLGGMISDRGVHGMAMLWIAAAVCECLLLVAMALKEKKRALS